MTIGRAAPLKVKVNSHVSMQAFVSFFILLAVLAVSCRYCDKHDYYSYFNSYMQNHKLTVEFAYTQLAGVFYTLGAPFYVFYGVLISFDLLLLWSFFREYGKNPLLLLLVFLIYPYINVLQQIRSFTGAVLMLKGLHFLTGEKKQIISFIGCVLLAMLFHYTSVAYLVFIFVINMDYKKLGKCVMTLYVIGIPIILALRKLFFLIFPYIPYFNSKYLALMRNDNAISLATIIDNIIFFIIVVGTWLVTKGEYAFYSPKTQKLLKCSYAVFALALLRGLGNNGYRMALMAYPIFYAAFDNAIYESNSRTSRFVLRSIFLTFPALSVFLWWGPLNPNMFQIVKTEMWRVWDYYYY